MFLALEGDKGWEAEGERKGQEVEEK